MKFLVLDTFTGDSANYSDDLAAIVVRVDVPLVRLAALALDLFRRQHKSGLHTMELAIDDEDYGIWAYHRSQDVIDAFGPLAKLSDTGQFPFVATDIDPTSCVVDNELYTPITATDISLRFWFNRWSLTSSSGYSDPDLRMSVVAHVPPADSMGEPFDNPDDIPIESVFVPVVELAKLLA